MSEQAARINAENLDQRLTVSNPRDELGLLAASFNELLARLASALDIQKQFMAEASHELRTPLSVMLTTTQVTLEAPNRIESEYRDAFATLSDQTLRLSRIVNDLITLARVDAGRPLALSDFYLDELIDETSRATRPSANGRGVRVEVAESLEARYRGDKGLLGQMLLNLLENAIKNTSPGGVVRVNHARIDSIYQVVIADAAGISVVAAVRYDFDRPRPLDQARSHANGHTNANGGRRRPWAISRAPDRRNARWDD
jgi:signal transduction histidine kinase